MGISSYPITTRCLDECGKVIPRELVKCNEKCIPDEEECADRYTGGYFNDVEWSDNTSFHDMIMSDESVKLYGYISPQMIHYWTCLFQLIAAQNPDAHTLEAHYYCSDEEHPFYFSYTRNNGKLKLNKGNMHSVVYHDMVHEKKENVNEEYVSVQFNHEKYEMYLANYFEVFSCEFSTVNTLEEGMYFMTIAHLIKLYNK